MVCFMTFPFGDKTLPLLRSGPLNLAFLYAPWRLPVNERFETVAVLYAHGCRGSAILWFLPDRRLLALMTEFAVGFGSLSAEGLPFVPWQRIFDSRYLPDPAIIISIVLFGSADTPPGRGATGRLFTKGMVTRCAGRRTSARGGSWSPAAETLFMGLFL